MKKMFLPILAALFVSPVAWSNTPLIEACTQTVQKNAIARDAFDIEQYVELFAEDAVLQMMGKTIEGREAITKFVDDQSRDMVSFHNISTIHIEPTGDNSAEGTVYVSVHFAKAKEKGPAELSRIINAVYTDSYTYEDGSCEIATRQADFVMSQQFAGK